jgi:hypothetical protein
MSLDKMSATIRQRVVSRLKEVITGSAEGTPSAKQIKNFEEYTSTDQIRYDTDTVGGRHESIMSRGAFNALKLDMQEAIRANQLAEELKTIAETADFDAFVAYISQIYYKDSTFLLTDNRRVKNGFVYSGPTRNTEQSVAVFAKEQGQNKSQKDVLLLKNIPQGKLVSYYADFIASNSSGMTEDIRKKLKSSLQGGHLTGVFTARLIRAFGLRKDTGGTIAFSTKSTNLSDLEKQLGSIVDLVTDADFLSSNISLDIRLFTETDKRLYSNSANVRLTTEVQFAKSNKESGQILSTAGVYLSKLIKSVQEGVSTPGQEAAAQKAFKKMLENLKKVNLYVKDRATQLQNLSKTQKLDDALQTKITAILKNQQTFEALISTEGSPSMRKHIENLIKSAIVSKSGTKNVSSRSVLKTVDIIKIGTPKAKIKVKSAPKKAGSSLNFKQPRLKTSIVSTVNLISLQNLINQNLASQIKQNMGTGGSNRVLNYRTGRFAESANVERLLESREGMITAFYSYMRNPYGTFAEGGAQESPASRNPKLLIAQSIRELAGAQVANRMRAVLV